MRSFQFEWPTKVLLGPGKVAELGRMIPEGARVLVVFGSGSAKATGIAEEVLKALAGRSVSEHWGVTPNPALEDLTPLVDLVRGAPPDWILAVGGGSVIDAAKFAAAVGRADVDPLTVATKNLQVPEPIPVGAVVTMAGTGSEANGIAAISSKSLGRKLVYINPLTRPRFAVIDPEYLLHLPRRQLENGLVDAFVHVLEQYVTFDVGARLQERISEALLSTLLEVSDELLSGASSTDARMNFAWAASLAQGGLLQMGVPEDWATHYIGHELTARFGVDHARSLAMVLPLVYRKRMAKKQARLAQLGERVFGLSGSPEARAEGALAQIELFFERVGVTDKLSDLKMRAEDVEAIVLSLKTARRVRLGEALDVTLQDVQALLEGAR